MSHFDEKAELVEAKAPQYTWKQSLEEVQVFVPVPAGTRGKQIQCDVKTNKLLLRVNNNVIIDVSIFNCLI